MPRKKRPPISVTHPYDGDLRKLPLAELRKLDTAIEGLQADSLWTWGPNPPERVPASSTTKTFMAAASRYRKERREALAAAQLIRSTPEGLLSEPAPADHPLRQVLAAETPPEGKPSTGRPRGRPRIEPDRPRPTAAEILAFFRNHPHLRSSQTAAGYHFGTSRFTIARILKSVR